MSFMRPRKTLQLGFDKQFQPSDEISLGRSGAKRVILCKHEKSGWGIEVLTWSQTPSLLSILWLWHSMDCSYLGISVTAEDIIGWRPEFTTLLSQDLSHFTAGTFTWEAAWQGATLTVTGGWLTCSPCVIMVTGDTPHHGQHHIMCSPLSTCVSLYNAITHITRGKVSRPQVGLGEDRWRTLGHVSAPRSDWELTVQVCDSVMFAAVPAPCPGRSLLRPVCVGRTQAARTSRPGLTL